VNPSGDARIVAGDLAFPNGAVITPDGATLIVAESAADRLTAFDIEPDGALSGRRVWASMEGLGPDGICLDDEGALWISSPLRGELLRMREGGELTHRLVPTLCPYACMLGGPDRRTLFVCESVHLEKLQDSPPSGRIEFLEVDVPGVGRP